MINIKRAACICLAAIMALFLLAGCSGENEPYLKVNDEAINDEVFMYNLKSSMYRVMASYGATESSEAFWTASLEDGVTAFDKAVETALNKSAGSAAISKKFDEYGLEFGEKQQTDFDNMYASISGDAEQYQEFLTQQSLTDEAVKTILTDSIKQSELHTFLISEGHELYLSDDRVRAFYDDNYFGAKHILFKTVDSNLQPLREEEQQNALRDAEKVLDDIRNGADFDNMMIEHSQDTASANETKGTLFTKEMVVPEFAQGAEALQPGEVSELVESQYGYHIIMKLDLFEENKEDIYNTLSSTQFNTLVTEWIDGAKVSLNEKRIKKLDPVTLLGV